MIESDRARKTGSALARAFGRTAMVLLAALILLPLAACNGEPEAPDTEWTPAEDVGDDEVRFHFVDTEGKPVAGATVGIAAGWFDMDDDRPLIFQLAAWADGETVTQICTDFPVSDDNGVLVLQRDNLFHPKWPADRMTGIYAIQEDRKLGALGTVSQADMGCEARMPLAPLQRVNVRATSSELDESGQSLEHWMVRIGQGRLTWATLHTDRSESYLLLPPGKYPLEAAGFYCERVTKTVTVPAGEDAEVSFDLPATRLAKLIGKPAPPLKEIDAWIGEPVTLDELKGRVVILDFWGVWCGPCVGQMTDLMRFHDEYADQGLTVVTVHNTSQEMSREEIAETIGNFEKEAWEREFPFPVAIEHYERTPIPGSRMSAYGPTGASYGVRAWPTTVLIDREGIVRGVLSPDPEAAQKRIEELLAEN